MSAPPLPPPSYDTSIEQQQQQQQQQQHLQAPPPLPAYDYESATRQFLEENNWPRNLQDVLFKSNQTLPLRFVIVRRWYIYISVMFILRLTPFYTYICRLMTLVP